MSHVRTKNFTVRLRYATIKTKHLTQSVAFYEQVLQMPRTKTDANFVQLDAGSAELCIDRDDGGELNPGLIFAVDDLPALCRELEARGIEVIAGGPDKEWAMVRDPDGNEVVFER
jgi:catechol 2,3-dioxygenase-like lactoylglutathione lyase family enzyme